MDNCFFCNCQSSKIVFKNDNAYAIYDDFPVSKGHMLIITKRHINSIDMLTKDDCDDIINLLYRCISHINMIYNPDGYNVGMNYKKAAGQTVFHIHIHIIPRYNGDVTNPKGGIRNIFNNGDYLQNV